MQLSRRQFIYSSGLSVLGIGFCGCHATPITGRKRVILVPESQEVSLGLQAFEETLSNETPSQNERLSQLTESVQSTRLTSQPPATEPLSDLPIASPSDVDEGPEVRTSRTRKFRKI